VYHAQSDGKTTSLVLELLQLLVPSVVDRCRETSALGSMARAQDELKKLKLLPKTVETTDHLMVGIFFRHFFLHSYIVAGRSDSTNRMGDICTYVL